MLFKSKNRKLVEKTIKALDATENKHMLPGAFDEITAENILKFIGDYAHMTSISEPLPRSLNIIFGVYISGKIYSVDVALWNGDCIFQDVHVSNESPSINDLSDLKKIGDKIHEKALQII